MGTLSASAQWRNCATTERDDEIFNKGIDLIGDLVGDRPARPVADLEAQRLDQPDRHERVAARQGADDHVEQGSHIGGD